MLFNHFHATLQLSSACLAAMALYIFQLREYSGANVNETAYCFYRKAQKRRGWEVSMCLEKERHVDKAMTPPHLFI
jgi:hypothetical protein